MKKNYLLLNRYSITSWFLFVIVLFSSCKKDDWPKPKSYPSDVLDKWMTLQLRLMRNATGIANHAFSRHFAYAGVAVVEAIKPGLYNNKMWTGKWNGLSGLPATQLKSYYHPANANAALATINRALFPNASTADKMSIDSLEAALNESFLLTQPQTLITSSSNFGKAVATAVFNWAEIDGYKNANNAYTPPPGAGLWVPTPPAFASAATPYWGQNRTIVYRSIENTQPAAPPPYSTDPASPFFKMVQEVYTASQNLTDDQRAMAVFWRDVPGATSPGHWVSIVQQAIRKTNAPLDKAALAYAFTGIAINDALISCFITKYQVNLVRPITYIREVMKFSTWNSVIGTPAHPEYSSAHAALSGAAAAVLQELFGDIGSLTDHTYDYLGFAPRTYSSFTAIGEEAGQSRLYAGIHYQLSIDAALWQGRKVANNVLGKIGGY